MGTGHPRVEITAATLAGGEKNQDRYGYGDGWAFVLDGASSFATTQLEHDGGWYADHLKEGLSAGLERGIHHSTAEIVEEAIRTVADLHGDDAASCPTSTIALARWCHERVEVYLLGDSTASLIAATSEEELSDSRVADVGRTIREEYRSRLTAGHGFTEEHRQLLQRLQAEQAAARNQPGGYWIAGSDPKAANHGLTLTRSLSGIDALVLATDGAAAGCTYGIFSSWGAFAQCDLETILREVHEAESRDPEGIQWPRSKPHDDKTAIVIHGPL
ncbi:hypothetical protein [Janibacter limosus]|uniref:hypothetical protein n=1 Tax=Janibacter limosus TaxID=53458 RepID=UPI0012EE6104|nr:hypothetical protein [Janibacter limosus]